MATSFFSIQSGLVGNELEVCRKTSVSSWGDNQTETIKPRRTEDCLWSHVNTDALFLPHSGFSSRCIREAMEGSLSTASHFSHLLLPLTQPAMRSYRLHLCNGTKTPALSRHGGRARAAVALSGAAASLR